MYQHWLFIALMQGLFLLFPLVPSPTLVTVLKDIEKMEADKTIK